MKSSTEAQFIYHMICSILTENHNLYLPKNLDWNKIYELSVYHKVDNIMGYVVEQLTRNGVGSELLTKQLIDKFKNAKYAGIMREAIQHNELEKLTSLFEKNQIDFLLLKGSILKDYYPSSDMRFLTDIDILAKQKNRSFIQTLLESQGYRLYQGSDHHDVYLKKPCMTIEVHWNCYTHFKSLDDYMDGVWNRSQLLSGNHHYQMSFEDFYLFQIGHFAKHFENGGVGLRMVFDFLIYQQSISHMCNQTLINEQIEKAGLKTLENKIKEIIDKGIKQECLEYDLVWNYIENSGAYAVYEHWAQNEIGKSKNKIDYLKKRIFPSKEVMEHHYPWLDKYPYLILFGWIHRFLKKVMTHPSRIKKELKIFSNKQQRNQILDVMKEMNLGEKNE